MLYSNGNRQFYWLIHSPLQYKLGMPALQLVIPELHSNWVSLLLKAFHHNFAISLFDKLPTHIIEESSHSTYHLIVPGFAVLELLL